MEKLSLNHDSLWSGGPFENAVSAHLYFFLASPCSIYHDTTSTKEEDKNESIELRYDGRYPLLELSHLIQLELTAPSRHILEAIRLPTNLPTLPKYGTRYSQRARAVRMNLNADAAHANYYRCFIHHRL